MIKALVNGKEFQIETGKKISLNGEEIVLDTIGTGPDRFHVLFGGKSYSVEILERNTEEKTVSLKVNNHSYTVSLRDKMDELLKSLGMENMGGGKVNELKAPMPGLVVEVRVQEGQEVKKGDPLLVLEAMKMENVLKCPADVTVKKINVQKGDKVEKNQVLIHFA